MSKTTLGTIRAAITNRTLVRIVRAGIQTADREQEGVPVAVGNSWVVFTKMGDGINLSGFGAVRLNDITTLQTRFERRAFYVSALRMKRARISAVPPLDLTSAATLLKTAQNWFSLLVVERELAFPNTVEIGRVTRSMSSTVEMRLVSSSAKSNPRSCRIRVADITAISFGGQYEDALADVAGFEDPGWK
ncbi:MAG: hypothetical protein M3Z05_20515 [Gemmatimonadota bacterium]|nr:hypothetical protein [Gemmatimonadota bacterium]